jgi:cytochrome d ubiquinol oxidase subunit II
MDADGNIHTTLVSLLTPFALLIGVTTVFMLATHGAIFLSMKTEGELLERVKRAIPRLMIVFFALNTVVVAATVYFHEQIAQQYLNNLWLVIFPLGALVAVIIAWVMVRQGSYFVAFLASSAMIALLILAVAAGLFPNVLISTIDPSYNLTVFNAASAANTLQVMLVIAIIGIPFILLYTTGVYYFFRGKVRVGPGSY